MTDELKKWIWKTGDPRPDNIPSWEAWNYEPSVEFWIKAAFDEVEKQMKGYMLFDAEEAIRFLRREWF